MRFYWKAAAALGALGIWFSSNAAPADSIFGICADLRKTVDFWKKIYSEVSLREGVIHDAGYPFIRFKTLTGDPSASEIRREKEAVARLLNTIETKPESTWTDDCRRIAELYRTEADSSALPGAAERIRFQRGQRERFIEGLERSGMFLDTIRAIFRAHGIPERVAYLPHVESAFNPDAYSRVGAAGLWQFMRRTGRHFGMKITYVVDERRDPVRATVAAARYLSKSYAVLSSWPLAITSYNHGLEGIRRAVAATGSNDLCAIVRSYSSRSFKFASSNFYCCFLAVSELAENRAEHFPDVVLLPPLRYNDIILDRFVTPSAVCNYLKIDRARLARLNPSIRPVIFARDRQLPKGLSLHIPDTLPPTAAIVALASIPDPLKSDSQKRHYYYRVKRGDNLYGIAARHGLTVEELAFENEFSSDDRLRVGQVLRIPGAAPVSSVAAMKSDSVSVPASSIAAAIRDTAKPRVVAAPKAPAVQIDSTAAKPAVPETTSQQFALSKVPIPRLPLHAPLKEARAHPRTAGENDSAGRQTTVTISTAADFDAALYQLDAAPAPDGKSAVITVSVDETMSHYCDWLSVGGWRIRRLNGMGSAAPIRIGRRLRIPLSSAKKLDTFTTVRLEYHLAIEEDFYGHFKVVDIKPRVVKSGDNLWDLCNEGGDQLPLWLLRKYNKRLDLAALRPGDTLQMPVVEERRAEETASAPERNPSDPDKPMEAFEARWLGLSPLRTNNPAP